MKELAWYVVQTHPNKEGFVRERIEDFNREVFLPLVRERVPGSRRMRTAPLFPGYLFARLSASSGDLPLIRWSPGVRRMLGSGQSPAPVADVVIESVRARTDRQGRVRVGLRLKPGSRVRIVEGPLAGIFGLLERPATSPDQRVSVLLEVFQRLTRVEVPASAVWGETA